ncbi:MAG TPA: nuclear transport factor 2 family protein [Cyclobacteriaceae bacterium]|nr:nuclear transport factor 2 family protein [Cyclobacteriaceae bacterium]
MKNLYSLLMLCMIALGGCQSSTSNGDIDESTTQEVLDHHWQTFVANDLEGVMEDYTEESILVTPNGTYKGLEQIRQNFINAFNSFPYQSSTLTLAQSKVVQDIGYILWEADTPNFTLEYATDTFIIRDGKIIRQTYAGVSTPK